MPLLEISETAGKKRQGAATIPRGKTGCFGAHGLLLFPVPSGGSVLQWHGCSAAACRLQKFQSGICVALSVHDFAAKCSGSRSKLLGRDPNAFLRYFPAAQFADLAALPSSLPAFPPGRRVCAQRKLRSKGSWFCSSPQRWPMRGAATALRVVREPVVGVNQHTNDIRIIASGNPFAYTPSVFQK